MVNGKAAKMVRLYIPCLSKPMLFVYSFNQVVFIGSQALCYTPKDTILYQMFKILAFMGYVLLFP